MKLFNGKQESEKILFGLKSLQKKSKTKPGLAVILVGKDRASKLYIKNKKKAAKKIGARVFEYRFAAGEKEANILKKIEDLNNTPSVNGIVVQLPLPKKFKAIEVLSKISASKDVDGFSLGKDIYDPPLPSAILMAMKKAGFKRKRIVALVNSDIFGKTLKGFLDKKKIKKTKKTKIDYLLRKNFTPGKIKNADIVISVCGFPNLIKGNMIKKGAVLIDGGITLIGKRIIGDVDRKSLENKASFLTPVPGGLGPLNVALLLKNVYLAWKSQI